MPRLPLSPDTKFYVVSWRDGSILAVYDTADCARLDAKARGWEDDLSPRAYVVAEYVTCGKSERYMFYKPRFK